MQIVYMNGMFSIKSENIYFSLIEGIDKNGLGLQLNDESKRKETEEFCLNLYFLFKKNKELL